MLKSSIKLFNTSKINDYTCLQNQIDIWQFNIDNTTSNINILAENELIRANNFYFIQDKIKFVNSHIQLRIILAKYLNIPADQIIFSEDEHAKPVVDNAQGLHFNLSHSGNLGLLAIGLQPVGIDLEYYSKRPYLKLSKEFLQEDDYNFLKLRPKSLRAMHFFNLWVQKEAFVKYIGKGLNYDLKSVKTSLNLPPYTFYALQHKTISFMPQINYCAALCIPKNITNIRYNIC